MNNDYFTENRDGQDRLVVQKLPLGEVVVTIENTVNDDVELAEHILNFLNKA